MEGQQSQHNNLLTCIIPALDLVADAFSTDADRDLSERKGNSSMADLEWNKVLALRICDSRVVC